MQTDEIVAKLSLKKFVPIKKRNVDFSDAATDNINALLDIKALILSKNIIKNVKSDEIIKKLLVSKSKSENYLFYISIYRYSLTKNHSPTR